MRRQSASLDSRNVLSSSTAALLMRMSTGPSSLVTRASMAATLSGFVMSAGMPMTVAPASPASFFAAAATASPLMSTSASLTPSAASRRPAA